MFEPRCGKQWIASSFCYVEKAMPPNSQYSGFRYFQLNLEIVSKYQGQEIIYVIKIKTEKERFSKVLINSSMIMKRQSKTKSSCVELNIINYSAI
jgi:hypothetical protein